MRTKEIGIRKAHGASANQIIRSLLIDFILLIFVAVMIVFPAFYGIGQLFVQDLFAYSTETGPEHHLYGIAGLIALFSGVAAVLPQIVRVAKSNPAESLRYE
jgi:putative ABC transport system permease protein